MEFAEQVSPVLIGNGKFISKAVGMASVDDYLNYAAECVTLASKSTNPSDKARLLEMARAWRDLAEKRGMEDQKKDPTG
jgi:hypothetical protein